MGMRVCAPPPRGRASLGPAPPAAACNVADVIVRAPNLGRRHGARAQAGRRTQLCRGARRLVAWRVCGGQDAPHAAAAPRIRKAILCSVIHATTTQRVARIEPLDDQGPENCPRRARRLLALVQAKLGNSGTTCRAGRESASRWRVLSARRGAAASRARRGCGCRAMSSRLRLSCFSGVAYDAADAALRDAAAAGDADGVKAALARGADVDCRSADDPDTPLFLAVMLRTTEAAAALLKAGASVHARNSHGAHQPRSQRRSAMRRCQLGVWRRWGGGRATAAAAPSAAQLPAPARGRRGRASAACARREKQPTRAHPLREAAHRAFTCPTGLF